MRQEIRELALLETVRMYTINAGMEAGKYWHSSPLNFEVVYMSDPELLRYYRAVVNQIVVGRPDVLAVTGHDTVDDLEMYLSSYFEGGAESTHDVQVMFRQMAPDTPDLLNYLDVPPVVPRFDWQANQPQEFKLAERLIPAIRASGLLDAEGALSRLNFLEMLLGFDNFLIETWDEHGGQFYPTEADPVLSALILAGLEFFDLSSGEWDQAQDGYIYRPGIEDLKTELETFSQEQTLERVQKTFDEWKEWDAERIESFAFEAITRASEEVSAKSEAKLSLQARQMKHAHPPATPYGVSPAGAEAWVRDWLRHMGLEAAKVTSFTGDGGIDVESPSHIAQVKHYVGTVPISEIREMVGVAAVDQRIPLFFTSGSFPLQAPSFADNAGMALFQYDVTLGEVVAINDIAASYMETGF